MRDSLNDANSQISVSIWPLPITKIEESYNLAQDSFSAWFLLVLSFPFISGAFVSFVVAERESKAKHLQTVAGVNASAYWLSTYIWDIVNYQLPLWSVIALMFLLDVGKFVMTRSSFHNSRYCHANSIVAKFSAEAFITKERNVVTGTFVLLILFGPASAGFSYIVSFFFKSPSMCNLFTIVFNFFIAMAGPIICFLLRLLAVDPSNPKLHLKTAAIVIEWILRLVPSFCLGRGLLFSINIGFFEIVEGKQLSVWSPTIALYDMIALGVESVIYIVATIRIDILSSKPKAVTMFQNIMKCMCLRRKRNLHTGESDQLDDLDVSAENKRVFSGQADNELIILKGLTKRYPNGKLAVDHMWLGIPHGQCFGLLGVNGAGMWSFSMIFVQLLFNLALFPCCFGHDSKCNTHLQARQLQCLC